MFEAFQFEFFRNGTLAAMMTGALCGLIGVYIVLRGMSYIGHGLSHAIFGGAVVSALLNVNFYLGAGLWGFLAALLINQTARRARINADAAIGVITTASFAIGLVVISRARKFTKNFDAALFGNILAVDASDVLVIALLSVLIGGLILVFYKQLLFTSFNSDVARVYGVPTEWVETLFALLLAGVLIASMNILGVTLIAAALVVPAITARLLTDSFHRMVAISSGLGAFSGFAGMLVSYWLDTGSGATIVLTQTSLFVLALGLGAIRRSNARRMVHTHV